jgi:hypothetical protein
MPVPAPVSGFDDITIVIIFIGSDYVRNSGEARKLHCIRRRDSILSAVSEGQPNSLDAG